MKIKGFLFALIMLGGCDAHRHLTYHDPHLKSKQETYNQLTNQEFWEKPAFTPKPQPRDEKPVFPKSFQKTVSLTIVE